MTSELLWVAVPGGRVEKVETVEAGVTVTREFATLRAVVVPRLQSDRVQPLSAHAMDDWPALLEDCQLSVERAPNRSTAPTTVSARRTSRGSSDLWRAFFKATMDVNPWGQQRPYDPPTVSDTSRKAETIARNYRAAAREFASTEPNANPSAVIQQQYSSWRNEPQSSEVGASGPDWTPPDFHRSVAFLREHPRVLKALGLIVEFSIDVRDLAASTADRPHLLKIRCSAPSSQFRMTSPWTRFEFDRGLFLPAPPEGGQSDIRKGLVFLGRANLPGEQPQSDKWQVVTFDVEGAAGRMRDAARSFATPATSADEVSLPTLQSAGLLLMRRNRVDALRARTDASLRNRNRALDDLELSSDDLVLGYRVDVRHQHGEWFSLCEREATYKVNDLPIAAGLEEGHLKANTTVLRPKQNPREGEPKDELHANEVVMGWSGWSLVLPQPVFDANGLRRRGSRPLQLPFDFKWDYALAGPLPKLRFGKSYQIRMRVADLAGGGLPLKIGDSADQAATEVFTYQRSEPVAPPELAPVENMFVGPQGSTRPDPKVFGPGGSIDGLVIRSDPAGTSPLENFAGTYPKNSERILLPPPTTMALAEQHEAFDAADERTWGWARRAMSRPVSMPDGRYSWLPDRAAIAVVLYVRPEPGSPAGDEIRDRPWGPQWPDLLPKRLELKSASGDGDETISWNGDTAVVRLAPAEQITLEVTSSFNAEDLENFEVNRWLAGMPQSSVTRGRHPMVTPPRVLSLVHAVKKPLTVPRGVLNATRAKEQTFAIMRGTEPSLNVDAASTAQVDVSAVWTDWNDDQPFDIREEVTSVPVARGATRLPDIKHELGDTRHRRIVYKLTAVSRFKQFFEQADPATPASEAEFLAAGTLPEVIVPSSARPIPPILLSAAPSFRWEGVTDFIALGPAMQPVIRKRLGGRVRLEMSRPWNLSGGGEQVAVITANASDASPSDALRNRVSLIYRDPIWGTETPAQVARVSMFAGMAGEARPVTLAEGEGAVTAIPYGVQFDEQEKRWIADVHIPHHAASSYAPFARLSIARFQPHSIPDAEMSPVVFTDFVQVMPDRSLSIQRVGDALQVRLQGKGPSGPRPNRVIVTLEECALPDGQNPNAVELTARTASIIGWHRIAGTTVSGDLNALLTLALPTGSGFRRLVVREVEGIDADIQPTGDELIQSDLRKRIVFVDVVRVVF